MKSDESAGPSVRAEQWKRAGEAMEQVWRKEIPGTDTAQALRNFTGTVLAELRRRPERTTSGLVEQQRWFRRLR